MNAVKTIKRQAITCAHMQVGQPVGVMGLEQDLKEWYGQQPLKLGMGYRPCETLNPSFQVGTPLCFCSLTNIHCLLYILVEAEHCPERLFWLTFNRYGL